MRFIQLTDGEYTALMQLLDMATKHGGLGVVRAVAHLVDKLETALKEKNPFDEARDKAPGYHSEHG
jgi:hypothetical protein